MASRKSYRLAVRDGRSSFSASLTNSPTDVTERVIKPKEMTSPTEDALNNNSEVRDDCDTLTRFSKSLVEEVEGVEEVETSSSTTEEGDSTIIIDDVLYDTAEAFNTATIRRTPDADINRTRLSLKPSAADSNTDSRDTKTVAVMSELAQRLQGTNISSGPQAENSKTRVYDDVAPLERVNSKLPTVQVVENIPDYDDVYNGIPDMVTNDLYHQLESAGTGDRPSQQSDTLQSVETIYESVDYQDDVDGSFRRKSCEESNHLEGSPSSSRKTPKLMERIAGTLRFGKSKNRNFKGKSFALDMERHPPPQLPPCPHGLTEKQQKRRYIVASIVEIENSYVNSLISLLENYKQPLLENGILPQDRVETIFHKLDDILDCHLMFQIALQDRIHNWDDHELLGDDFSGISKELVLDCYSEFINNYMTSNELFRKFLREKHAFGEFINGQMKKSKEMIGPRDQMIKVVQRFPQYILQLKDLIKHTPPDHADYMKLNIALSKLENVAYQLNEKKRASEERLAARVILAKLWGTKAVSDSILLRQDDVTEVTYNTKGEILYQKGRRLLLFSDMICLIKIENGGADEKMTSKWRCPMKYVEYLESQSTSVMKPSVKGHTGSILIQSNSARRLSSDSSAANESAALVYKELDDLIHDQAVLGQIMGLTSSLRQDYKGLNMDTLQEQLKNVQTSIRLGDEQLQMLDSCVISLSYIKNNQQVQSMFHMASPVCKQDWVMDFRAVKLAQDAVNHIDRCWLTDEAKRNFPLVVRNVNVDVTSTCTQVTCATPIFLTNSNGGIGLQYLWVCSNNEEHGQVTLLSIHANKPHIIESFKACNGAIDCCLLVSSDVHSALDHMWMADATNTVYVHGLRDGEWRSYNRKFSVSAQVKAMCCYKNFVFLALADGVVLKYAKRRGSALFLEPQSQRLGDGKTPVNCLLPSDNNKILAACGNTLFMLSTINDLTVIDKYELNGLSLCIDKMVQLGYGIWYSCTGDPSLRLIHYETYNSISEVHIGNALSKLRPNGGVLGSKVAITALTTSQGLVWVGTSTGHILTIPVPMLEGIPQQSGRVNLSSLCHTSPVKFISTIQCSITFAPRAVSEDDLRDMNHVEDVEEESDIFDSDEYVEVRLGVDQSSGPPAPSRQNSLAKMRQKMAERSGGNLLKQSKAFAISTPNLAFNRMSDGSNLQKPSQVGMYGSLMKLDDFDATLSAADLVNNLVPTNQLPLERFCTKISTQKGTGKLKVTRSSSISNLTPHIRPLSKNRSGVQSMWSLSTTSSHSIHSEPTNPGDTSLDNQYTELNLELKDQTDSVYARLYDAPKSTLGHKMGSRLRNSQTLSVNSLLSRVAEDEECIYDEQLSPMAEYEDFEHSFPESDTSTIYEFDEEEEERGEEDDAESSAEQEALVFTNVLKASLIVSGGEGFVNLHDDAETRSDESTLIMWQQNQT